MPFYDNEYLMNASDYRILGISEGASAADIRAAYRRLARKYHPDSNLSDPARAAKQFAALKSAHDRLLAAPKQTLKRAASPRPNAKVRPSASKMAKPNVASSKRSGDGVDDMMSDIMDDLQSLYKGVTRTLFRRSKERV